MLKTEDIDGVGIILLYSYIVHDYYCIHYLLIYISVLEGFSNCHLLKFLANMSRAVLLQNVYI